MPKRKYVRLDFLKDGMRIDQSIVDSTGRQLIKRGTILDEYMISSMQKRGVVGVYIGEGEDDVAKKQQDDKEPEIPKAVQETIEQNRVEDRANVTLQESVKKRVQEGISYLYSNTDSDDFTEASTSVTEDLLRAISENEAVAVDVDALKVSDEYTFKHSVDVATMAMIVAKKHGLTEQEVYEIGVSGLLHDVGKSQIPSEILNSPNRLSDEEFAIMKQHSLYGYRILQSKEDIPEVVRLGVLQHHEKLNGNGYPMSVTADKICLYARILSIVDIYDALVTERSYKKAFSKRDAVEMIMAMTDELDISVMKSFLASVILYPVGSTVQLSNGEKAKVVENHPDYILRPKVVGLTTGKVYDLLGDLKYASIVIQ